MRRLLLLSPALLLAACAISPARQEGGPLWSEEVEIRTDEVFIADSRRLEIRPVSVGVQSAVLVVRARGILQEIELRSGPNLSRQVGDYRLELLGTSLEPSVRLRIMRLR